MAFTQEQYERRIVITNGEFTGEICEVCRREVVLDANIDMLFCCCGYRQWQREEIAAVSR
jgi:hypothetical protein